MRAACNLIICSCLRWSQAAVNSTAECERLLAVGADPTARNAVGLFRNYEIVISGQIIHLCRREKLQPSWPTLPVIFSLLLLLVWRIVYYFITIKYYIVERWASCFVIFALLLSFSAAPIAYYVAYYYIYNNNNFNCWFVAIIIIYITYLLTILSLLVALFLSIWKACSSWNGLLRRLRAIR